MNCLIVIALFIASALALPNVQQKEARKHHPVPCKDCGSWRPGHPGNPDHHSGHHPHHYDCHDPCQDCAEPRVSTKTFSPVTVQEVSDRTILVCSDESYYDRIEYDACYEWNTTCNGVIVGSANNVKGIYTGIKVDRHTGKETQEVLNARNIGWISTSNNGNSKIYENAELGDSGQCSGDVLRAISSWQAVDDPLTGCCTLGVNHQQSTSYLLNIFGKCCSECVLLQASISWRQPIKN